MPLSPTHRDHILQRSIIELATAGISPPIDGIPENTPELKETFPDATPLNQILEGNLETKRFYIFSLLEYGLPTSFEELLLGNPKDTYILPIYYPIAHREETRKILRDVQAEILPVQTHILPNFPNLDGFLIQIKREEYLPLTNQQISQAA